MQNNEGSEKLCYVILPNKPGIRDMLEVYKEKEKTNIKEMHSSTKIGYFAEGMQRGWYCRNDPANQFTAQCHNAIMVRLCLTGIMMKNDTSVGRFERANSSSSVYPENVIIIRKHGDRS